MSDAKKDRFLWPGDENEQEAHRQKTKQIYDKIDAERKKPLSPEQKEELRQLAIKHAAAARSRFAPQKKVEVKEEKTVVEKEPKNRQQRMGQTKFIDNLLKKGRSDKEIYDAVRKEISAYPEEKIYKLIKLRKYHLSK